MSFVVTGVNHRTLAVDLRERLFVSPEKLPALLAKIRTQPGIHEAVVVSTCNRTEVYAALDPSAAIADLQQALCQHLGVALADVTAGWYAHVESAAIRHLFRVVASLDSMLVGETQVFAQVKASYDAAYTAGATDALFNQLFHRAFFVAKRVRTETGIGVGSISLSSLAVDVIEQSVCFRTPPRLLVIGTGEMGRDAAKSFAKRRLGELLIVNRTPEKAAELAAELGGKALPWEKLSFGLTGAAAVVSCSGAPRPIITAELLASARQASDRKALTIVDLGVPRDVAADVASVDGTTIYNIDDLQAIADKNLAGREKEIARAEELIAAEAIRAYGDILAALPEPTIAKLMQKCEAIRRRELAKAFGRMGSLSHGDRRLIEQCTASIVSKILHDPIAVLKYKYEDAGDLRQRST